jgi:hypothetical protein
MDAPRQAGQRRRVVAATLRAAGFPVITTYVSDPTCESVGLVVGEQPSAGTLTLAGSYVTLNIAKAPSRGCLWGFGASGQGAGGCAAAGPLAFCCADCVPDPSSSGVPSARRAVTREELPLRHHAR